MNQLSNLLPIRSQIVFECRRQLRFWGGVWIATSIAMVAIYVLLDRERVQLNASIMDVEATVAPIREAEVALVQLKNEKQLLRQLAQNADVLQQTDAPLALLQSIGSSCQNLGKAIQIDSLRMDELSGPDNEHGKTQLPRKQILLTGSADADYLITAFVNRLCDSGVFRKVDLESSHATASKLSAKRSFQVRCQQ